MQNNVTPLNEAVNELFNQRKNAKEPAEELQTLDEKRIVSQALTQLSKFLVSGKLPSRILK